MKPAGNRTHYGGTPLRVTGLAGTKLSEVFMRPRIRIGRSRSADLQIDHECISARHAEIYVGGDCAVLVDCKSTNGMSAFGRPVEQLRMNLDEVYEVTLGGDVTLEICYGTPRRRAATPPAPKQRNAPAARAAASSGHAPPSFPRPLPPAPPPKRSRPSPKPEPVWLLGLPDGVRDVFRHLDAYGAINEQDATCLLGGPRRFREFSRRLEDYAAQAPFAIRIEVSAGIKCYVRGDR